jgi:uncharacterized protein
VNVGQTLDMTFYARDIGVSVSTIKRWLSILEASFIIFLLPPFYQNLGKRMIKSPKLYFYDTGLVCALMGLNTFDLFDYRSVVGIVDGLTRAFILQKTKKIFINCSSLPFYRC